ncbi:MAG: isochorismate synthase [Flavobacteriaceae bacterium]|nr:isochorismate synthase [Flavobacteriaceae bacterium]
MAKHSIAIVEDFNAVKGQKNKLKCISYFLTVPILNVLLKESFILKIKTTSFFDKITDSLKAKLPFVAYRHPEKDELKGHFQKNDNLHYISDFSESGFVFTPFDNAKPAVLFPLKGSATFKTNFSSAYTNFEEKNHQRSLSEASKEAHINLVKKGIDLLNTSDAKKVVLSRKEIIDCPDLNIVETFKRLLKNYTNAMVYVWFHPKVGLWLGATPETLLKVENDSFKTVSLAGTQTYQGSLDVVWQQKEKQEQQFVTDYIVEKLNDDITVSAPHTIKAGSLVHLCTDISGKLSQEFTLNRLIKLLHPTPAVCGLPMNEAKTFILGNEGYDRGFYTGFLGELNIDNSSNLFVNLRCMQVLQKQLAIYIGGGITIDSNPKKEWEETVAKSKVMLKVLN